MPAISTPHVRTDAHGVAWIDDTNVKVIEVVLPRLAHGWSPEEIHFQHPHLSLAQIHAALGYYYDHQEAMDQEIECQARELDGFLKPDTVWLDSGVDDLQRERALGERLWQKRQQELAGEAGTSAFLSPRGSVSCKRDVRPVNEGPDSPAQR